MLVAAAAAGAPASSTMITVSSDIAHLLRPHATHVATPGLLI
jgi:hypothetical protein